MAQYLLDCLEAYNKAVQARTKRSAATMTEQSDFKRQPLDELLKQRAISGKPGLTLQELAELERSSGG